MAPSIFSLYLSAAVTALRAKQAAAPPDTDIHFTDADVQLHMEKRAHQQPLVYCILLWIRMALITLMAHESAKVLPFGVVSYIILYIPRYCTALYYNC
eukprot:SAG25_NODE_66_length_17563_cov_34.737918_6_plen_98_part_00